MILGAAKFQVDVNWGGGVWLKRPVDVKQGTSECVNSPILIMNSWSILTVQGKLILQ